MSRMSETQIASRPLAPAPPKQAQWQNGPKAAFLAGSTQFEGDSRLQCGDQQQAAAALASKSQAPVDWSSYLDESPGNVGTIDLPDCNNASFEPDHRLPHLQGFRQRPMTHNIHNADAFKAQPWLPMNAKLQTCIPYPDRQPKTQTPLQSQQQQQQQMSQHSLAEPVGRPLGNSADTIDNADTSRQRVGRPALLPVYLTEDDAEPDTSNSRHQQRVALQAPPYADKENAQLAERRLPVRKSLFLSEDHQTTSESLEPGTVSHAAPSGKQDHGMVGDDAAAGQHMQHSKRAQPSTSTEMDFSSVFDFL